MIKGQKENDAGVQLGGLSGTFQVKLRANGYVPMPKPFLATLTPVIKAKTPLYLVFSGPFIALPEHVYHMLIKKWSRIVTISPGRKEAPLYLRSLARATQVEWSFRKHLIIPPKLLSDSGMKKGSNLAVLGHNECFEIWKWDEWEKHIALENKGLSTHLFS